MGSCVGRYRSFEAPFLLPAKVLACVAREFEPAVVSTLPWPTIQVAALVYADAYVPDSGASVWSLTSQVYRERFIAGVAADGFNCTPPAHLDSRCRPHPIATFLQAIELTGHWRNIRSKTFIAAFGWEASPFLDLYERLRLDPDWATHRLDCAHDIPRLAPEAFTDILLKISATM